VHLAYISASSGPGAAALPTAVLGALSFLFVALIAHATKVNIKFPKAWRLVTLAMVTAVGCLLVLGILTL
jgi:hypothetical protein